jgi:DNA polymerase III alpha subunit
MPDIDIDFPDREKALNVLKHIRASRTEDGKLVAHNTGVYLQEIPYNPVNNLANIDYKQAEDRGYFKIDFLNVSVYKNIKSEQHLIELMNQEPLWDLLQDDSFTDLLFHVNGYGNILRQMKPSTVEQLAMLLALIRPAKRHLLGKTWTEIGQEIWEKPTNGDYYFKKSHATAYAMAVVVQMNLICEEISYGYS